MDIHKNARLTSHSRAELVRRVLKEGQSPSATLSGLGHFRHDGVERLDRIADTPRGALLVMAKNTAGRTTGYQLIML